MELIALRLFTERGFDKTTIDEITATAGVSRRTFFRYFESKTSVLWGEFDTEIATIRRTLNQMPDDLPVMEAVRRAVIAANHYRAEDLPELRTRMSLIGSVPDLVASAALHYEAWEQAISQYVGSRTGQVPDSLYPLVVGRATLAACRAAFDTWAVRTDADLTVYLDTALRVLALGLDNQVLQSPAVPGGTS